MTQSPLQPPLTKAQTGFDYTALSPLGGQTAHIRFSGQFQGKEVIWDTHIITLQEYYRQAIDAGRLAKNVPVELFQYIEIAPKGPTEMTLNLAIDVPVIDAPTVFKSMIMIHNYKRLRQGRHEYGPAQQFP